MKKILVFVTLCLAILAAGCSKKEAKASGKDVVRDVTPVWQLSADREEILTNLRNMPENERGTYLARTWPQLSNNIVVWLRHRSVLEKNDQVTSVKYSFGSASSAKAEDFNGTIHEGSFTGELVAYVFIKGKSEPIMVAVQCLNGMFNVIGDFKEVYTEPYTGTFTIRPGEGLCNYVDYQTAIHIAEIFNLPIFMGKRDKPDMRITPEQAYELEDETDRIQVTVKVYTTDVFDLNAMTYNGLAP